MLRFELLDADKEVNHNDNVLSEKKIYKSFETNENGTFLLPKGCRPANTTSGNCVRRRDICCTEKI